MGTLGSRPCQDMQRQATLFCHSDVNDMGHEEVTVLEEGGSI